MQKILIIWHDRQLAHAGVRICLLHNVVASIKLRILPVKLLADAHSVMKHRAKSGSSNLWTGHPLSSMLPSPLLSKDENRPFTTSSLISPAVHETLAFDTHHTNKSSQYTANQKSSRPPNVSRHITHVFFSCVCSKSDLKEHPIHVHSASKLPCNLIISNR